MIYLLGRNGELWLCVLFDGHVIPFLDIAVRPQ